MEGHSWYSQRCHSQQQNGNDCALFAVKNAFVALGLVTPTFDSVPNNVDSKWIERHVKANGDPENITIVETYRLLTDKRYWFLLMDDIIERFLSSPDFCEEALIANTNPSGRGGVDHWVCFHIRLVNGNLFPIGTYDSFERYDHGVKAIAK